MRNRHEYRIVTVHEYPPIPDRSHDWLAYYDGEEERGEYGWGRTEAEAIADLVYNWQSHMFRAGPPLDMSAFAPEVYPMMGKAEQDLFDALAALSKVQP